MNNLNLGTVEDDPIVFHNTLSSVFKLKSVILEKSIAKELFSQLGERFESTSDFNYTTQMDTAKKLYSAKKKWGNHKTVRKEKWDHHRMASKTILGQP